MSPVLEGILVAIGCTGGAVGVVAGATMLRCMTAMMWPRASWEAGFRSGITYAIRARESDLRRSGARCVMSRRNASWPVTKGNRWDLLGERFGGEAYGEVTFRDRAGADPSEWPEHLRVREFPRFMRAA